MAKFAINGMGRIGRSVFKILTRTPGLELTAVNDLIDTENLIYMLKYDSVYGKAIQTIEAGDAGKIISDGKQILTFNEKDPGNLPWNELGIDLVFECTGVFTKSDQLKKHLDAGANRVILSAPGKDAEILTVVHGVNSSDKEAAMISCASCTTNCITPVVEVMDRRIGVKKATMTTVHAYTSSQSIVDGPNNKFARGRAAAANLVPTGTGAANATSKVLPQYKDKFNGMAIRTPVAVGSISDMVFVTNRNTDVPEINNIFEEESESSRYRGILGVTKDPIVSSDIIMDPRASIVDLNTIQVVDGDLVKIMSWYDNEWGYANQMVREAINLTT